MTWLQSKQLPSKNALLWYFYFLSTPKIVRDIALQNRPGFFCSTCYQLFLLTTAEYNNHTSAYGTSPVLVSRASCTAVASFSQLEADPHKRRHSHWKLSQELKWKYATFSAKYTCMEMASRKTEKYQNIKPKNLCTIYFVFDLDDECKFIKTKHHSD